MSTEKRPWAEDLAEARQFTAALSASLPSKVEIAALGVLSKAPFQLLTIREALIWRTEELARNACDALEKEDFAVTALLTRGITESAAMTWYLMEILEQRAQYTPAQLNEKLMRMFGGSKGLYSKIDRANFTRHFGRGFRAELAGGELTRALVGGLMAFDYAYNKIADDMPMFLTELKKIWPDENTSAK